MRLHAGEVAFPGGKLEEGDLDGWHTALREAEEEIALPPTSVQRLGQMPKAVSRTKIEVLPCVGVLNEPVELLANPDELESVFTVPLSFLADENNLHLQWLEHRGEIRQVPSYNYQGYEVWGMTARLLVELVNMACDAGLKVEGPDTKNPPKVLR